MEKEYTKNCPECNRKMYYTLKDTLNRSIKNVWVCNPCSKKGIRNPLFNKHVSDDVKNKISKSQKERCLDLDIRQQMSQNRIKKYEDPNERKKLSLAIKKAMHRPDVREKHLTALLKTKFLRRKTDVEQLELLEKWNKLGFNFEPNFPLKIHDKLFFIDGYDKDKNVVFEYDGKYHNKPCQKQKDLVRQNKIIDILKPKMFWRFDSVNKHYTNVMEGK